MFSKSDKEPANHHRQSYNAVSKKAVVRDTTPLKQFKDERTPSAMQGVLQEKGSHNKKQMIKIKSYTLRDNTTNAQTTTTENEDFDLGFIRGHPSGFTDWDDYARSKVTQTYGPFLNATLVAVDYRTFSKK